MKVVIIGAGAIGLSTAYYCLKEGMEVVVLEREAENIEGTSFGNAGLVVPSHFIPLASPGIILQGLKWMLNKRSPFSFSPRFSTDLLYWLWLFWRHANPRHVEKFQGILRDWNLESRRLFVSFAEEGGLDFQEKGVMMLCQSEKSLEEEAKIASLAIDLGLEAEILSLEQLKNLNPGFEMNVLGGIHFPQDAHLHPKELLSFLKKKIKEFGGEVLYEKEVRSFQERNGKIEGIVLKNEKELLLGDAFVVAAGVWSKTLLKEMGYTLPLESGKGYSITIDSPDFSPKIPALLVEARVAVTPFSNSLRFGGTMEIGSLSKEVQKHKVESILSSIRKYFPQFQEIDFSQFEVWQGYRPCSADGLPYIGQLSKTENLFIGSGHGMMGLSLSPITGAVLSDLLIGREPRLSVDPFNPNRF